MVLVFMLACKCALPDATVCKWSKLEGEYAAAGPGGALKRGGLWDVQSP